MTYNDRDDEPHGARALLWGAFAALALFCAVGLGPNLVEYLAHLLHL